MSHCGRPKSAADTKYSLAPAGKRLAELLGQPVTMAKDVIGESAETAVANVKAGEVVLLENVRFHKEEEKNDPEFAKKLATFGDLYVNDAFGTAHRAHASTAGVADYLPSAVGYLIKKELDFMGGALETPKKPFVAILGGAKVSDKIGVIKNLIDKVDTLIVGGGMAYTFYKAKGHNTGSSLLEEDKVELAKELMEKAEEKGVQFLLPIDDVVAKEFNNEAETACVEGQEIQDGWMGLDIGPKTQALYAETIMAAKTVIWNGPMGVFEMSNFAKGTKAVAEAMGKCEGITIIGGGDSAAAVQQLGYADQITHISTGGGASLEFLEGKVLPGVDVIDEQ
jgi:3-phosphoglycerate kinase